MKKIILLLLICSQGVNVKSQNIALNFDGTNDYLIGDLITPPTLFGSFTMECWVKSPTSPTNTNRIDLISFDNMALIWNDNLANQPGSAMIRASNGNYYFASFGQLNPNVWYHLASTYDGDTVKAFVNGVLKNVTITSGGLAEGYNSMFIGKKMFYDDTFNGDIDEIRIWNIERSNSTIALNYNKTIEGYPYNMYALINFQEGIPFGNNTQISSVRDYSTSPQNPYMYAFSKTGATSNFVYGPTLVTSSENNSLHFGGENDYINSKDSIDYTTEFTIEFWIKKNQLSAPQRGSVLLGDKIGVVVEDPYSDTTYAYIIDSLNIRKRVVFGKLVANNWYHLAVTFNGAEIKGYKNGILVDSELIGSGVNNEIKQLVLGCDSTYGSFFYGCIDEFRVWSIEKNCFLINQQMNQQISHYNDLLICYNFNKGLSNSRNIQHQTINDTINNSIIATLENFNLDGNTSNYVEGAHFSLPLETCVSVNIESIMNQEINFKIYPNPTNGLINIQTKDFNSSTKIVITDLLGKTLLNKQMNSQTEVINISQYESGIYFIKVYDNLKQKTIKVIKS